MGKKLLLSVVVICLLGSAALALDPMGPPVAGLKQGQFSAGLDYAYSEMNLKFDGKFRDAYDGFYPDWNPTCDHFKLKSNVMNKAYINIGYGITDGWEAFVRLGGANMYAKRASRYVEGEDSYDGYPYYWTDIDQLTYDSDTGFAIGFGTKVTLYEDTDLKVGALFQGSWSSVDYSVRHMGYSGSYPYNDDDTLNATDGYPSSWYVPTEGQMDFWEFQFAVGATYVLSPRFTVYGGPFYYIFVGDYNYKGEGWLETEDWDYVEDDGGYYYYNGAYGYNMLLKGSYDVKATGCFGGYLGAQIGVTDNVTCNAECQLANSAFALATNLTWRF